MRFLLLAALLALPASAAWEHFVGTAKGDRVGTAEPHPMAYFTEYPMLRDESGDFCYLCSEEKRLEEAKKFKIQTDLKLVGTLAGYAVYDLYYLSEGQDPASKLILVKTGPDEYRNIYLRHPTQVDAHAEPSIFVRIGDDQFLEAKYMAGGNHGVFQVEYFWFDETGATLLDLRPILDAAEAVLPPGRTVKLLYESNSPGTNDLWDRSQPPRTKVIVTGTVVDYNKPLGVDGYYGIVIVDFKFDHGRVVPTKVTYDPNARANQ
jgi:hypothetical protein